MKDAVVPVESNHPHRCSQPEPVNRLARDQHTGSLWRHPDAAPPFPKRPGGMHRSGRPTGRDELEHGDTVSHLDHGLKGQRRMTLRLNAEGVGDGADGNLICRDGDGDVSVGVEPDGGGIRRWNLCGHKAGPSIV